MYCPFSRTYIAQNLRVAAKATRMETGGISLFEAANMLIEGFGSDDAKVVAENIIKKIEWRKDADVPDAPLDGDAVDAATKEAEEADEELNDDSDYKYQNGD